MEIRGNRILVLGGWGQVGSAICRQVLELGPAQLIVSSLTRSQTEEAIEQLRREYPQSATDLVGEWGDIFARFEDKDTPRGVLLADPARRKALLEDLYTELTAERIRATFLHRAVDRYRPHVVIDCINLATAIAYRDVYASSHQVLRALGREGEGAAAELRNLVESHLANAYIPQLIRHVQILYRALLDSTETRCYLKIGTSGTGGMGLNIPYTHSEEKPSRVLLAKSALAGAHTLLLFLMGRTPGAPIVKEIKPAAAIAWKRIGFGEVLKGGKPVRLYELEMGDAVELGERLELEPPAGLAAKMRGLPERRLESVFIDTGENGVFSRGEFEAITALGQMEYVTPEEIATNAMFEIQGGNTGKDVIAALDQTCMGPTYRAGALRERAIALMHRMEHEHRVDSVAFENLGPPKLSKVLFEAYLLRRAFGTMEAVAAAEAEELQRGVVELVEQDRELRGSIVSIGIPILLSDGRRLLRAAAVKIPVSDSELTVTPERVDLWANDGWVDLRLPNFEHWKKRFEEILEETRALDPADTSSRHDRDSEYWIGEERINPGKVASWLFINEEKGLRMK